MFEYTICNQADSELFYKQCRALEKNIPGIRATMMLLDCLDGTLIQKYEHELGAILVKNDAQVDVLYVEAEFDLLPFFQEG